MMQYKLTREGEQRNIIAQLINENKKLFFTVEKNMDKLKQRKFIAVEKFRVLSYF